MDFVPYLRPLTPWGASKPFVAFRWKEGRIFGIYEDGEEREFIYIHLQKRQMRFDRGLENENSFLVFPTEFVHDHEITSEEITASITPSLEYEKEIDRKYRIRRLFPKLMRRTENFMHDTFRGKISTVKRLFDSVRHHGWMS